MAQALQREGLAHEPPSRDPLPSRSASWHTEPREAQGWGVPREHPRRSQSMHPGGGGDTQQLSMQRLKHVLAPAAPAHWSGAPPVRSQTWHPSVATRPEDLAAEKVRRGANRPATLYDPTCSAGAGNNSADSTPPRALTYCTCVTYAQVMQQQFNHDVRAAEQELAAEARGGVNTTRIEALRLKMQRWPLSAGLGFATSPHLSSTLHPSPNPKQVAGHLRARTGRATISSGHSRIAGMHQRHPQTLPLRSQPEPEP